MSAPQLTADWLSDQGTRTVLDMLEQAGFQAFAVGGCVRNTLLGLPVADIDVATDATPEQTIATAQAAGLRAVPTGIDHGTVTVIADQSYEVTSFRRDIDTDGRRATVAFSTDVAEDAARRDFTINALYVRLDGRVLDPNGTGLPDLAARRVRFIGDPAARIAEDGLRVLRFFRFAAHYANPAAPLDPGSLAAITAAPAALGPVSRERIGAEITKLLAAETPGPALAAMAETGTLSAVHPGATLDVLPRLLAVEGTAPPRWARRAVALAETGWAERLRLARSEARAVDERAAARHMDLAPHALAERFGAEVAEDAVLLAWAESGTPPPSGWQEDIRLGDSARFPLAGRDLAGRYPPGPEMGAALARLREIWVESRFTLDAAALLALETRDDP